MYIYIYVYGDACESRGLPISYGIGSAGDVASASAAIGESGDVTSASAAAADTTSAATVDTTSEVAFASAAVNGRIWKWDIWGEPGVGFLARRINRWNPMV